MIQNRLPVLYLLIDCQRINIFLKNSFLNTVPTIRNGNSELTWATK